MLLCVQFLLVAVLFLGAECHLSEEEMKNYLATTYEKEMTSACYKINDATFAFNTDIKNKLKEQIVLNTTLEQAVKSKKIWEDHFKGVNPNDYKDPVLRRKLKKLVILGAEILEPKKLEELTNAINSMTSTYSTAKICPFDKQKCDLDKEGLNLEPGMEQILSKSRNYDELTYVWKAWRDASGKKMRNTYKTYVELSNEAARANNFSDAGALWRDDYEDEDFVKHVDELWSQVEPLYTELHKFVGRKLKARYGDKLDDSDGLLPAQLFGNMWGQTWGNIAELVLPYPNASALDVDEAFKQQGYDALKMFESANGFFKSLNLISNERCYDTSKGAMIEKPTDGREVLCHASAWDFCDGETYRVKMCTDVNLESFLVIHHEMGHIEYFQLYKKQPITFREGANPGFHEAVGDTISLSVSTPKHLSKINLLQNYTSNKESDLNALMTKALDKVAFLPFGLLIDKWRWDVFSGSVPQDQWNSHWWKLRNKYQKLKAPVPRSEEDFDPGAKFHVAGDSQYIAYFVAHILQFQFYKSLCIAAGEYNPENKSVPLHECDFYNSVAAGQKLRDGLSLGSSVHWSEVLKVMTGEDKLNAGPLMEYFEPLYQYLKEENSKPITA
ncbi:angiotensin-converting enzyme isoform X2 [Aethina tumida]|uniref:angiotensin-converting enzyme isoform X2 n=1 Tax=Aethina tumida TaxID=116153 RepID=UPI00214798A8|nr:angiotensin-converting enzyme isoform X2 [Aethina tumida]